MSSRKECGLYFKDQPEYQRAFEAMRKKWESLGRTAGKVTLAKGTEKERRALERFLGRALEKDPITFSLPEFEKALGETRYGGVSLKELLEEYFGEPMVGSQEKKQHRKSKEQRFWDELEYQARTVTWEAVSWVRDMREQKSDGYTAVMKEYRKSEESAKELVRQVVKCLNLCGKPCRGQGQAEGYGWDGIRLAVLAAKATGNPHALDRQNTAGTLLTYVLCRRDGSEFPENARKWKELYERNGILMDELSSTVAAFGIHLVTKEGRHPAYEGYWERREPCVISLANLAHAQGAFGESEKIYIVENEMVFSELVEQLSDHPVTLLCTSGQPRTAAYSLLELLGESDEKVSFWYAGDMDPEGLDIAQRICDSFPGRVHIWRMSGEDYEKALSQEQVTERRMEMMKNLTHPVLKQTAQKIRKQKRAGYQELLLEEMAGDIKGLERAGQIK